MEEEVLEAYTEVRAGLYGLGLEVLKTVVKESLPGPAFSIETASRAKLCHAMENYLGSLEKERDKGLAILGELKAKLGLSTVKPDPVKDSKLEPSTKVSWRKDFKINGTIGDATSCISFMSFLRQLEVAKDKGYKESEIIDGIIRAIQPECRLRGYIEGIESLTLSVAQAIIRSFYHEKSSTELYQELCNLSQSAKESCQDFLLRALELRQKINFASKEATDFAYDSKLVEKQLHHSLITGVRDENIRLELDSLLQNYTTDEKLLENVNEMVRCQTERSNKFGGKPRVMSVMGTEESEVLEELKSLRLEVKELKSNYNKSHQSQSATEVPNKRKNRNSCKNCESSSSTTRCTHCYNCGSSELYQFRCPENARGSLQKKGAQ